jgi:hypothetical protein
MARSASRSVAPADPAIEGTEAQRGDTLPIRTDDAPARPAEPAQAPPPRRGGMPRSLIAALVVAVLVISGAVALNVVTGALDKLNPFHNGLVQNRTIDRSSPVVLKAINDLGDFRAASGYYQLVVDVEKDVKPVPSFLAGHRVLFIAAGTVEVGVNLRGLSDGAVKVNADRTSATITLAQPTLSQPNLDEEHSYIYSQQRGLFDRIKDAVSDNAADQQQLYTLASQKLMAAAQQNNELTTRAETNTRSMLEGLLRSLGFTDITIQFQTPTSAQSGQ